MSNVLKPQIGRPPRPKSMVEIAARALCLSKMNGPPESYAPGYREQRADRHWPMFTADARAVIEALTKPIDSMIVAGDEKIIEALNDHTFSLRPVTPAEAAFKAMIDEALK